jgi:hypothetical protein
MMKQIRENNLRWEPGAYFHQGQHREGGRRQYMVLQALPLVGLTRTGVILGSARAPDFPVAAVFGEGLVVCLNIAVVNSLTRRLQIPDHTQSSAMSIFKV